jgi:hypothetical protein
VKGASVSEAGNFNNREPLFIFHHINHRKVEDTAPLKTHPPLPGYCLTLKHDLSTCTFKGTLQHSHLLALTEPHLVQEAENKFTVLENVIRINVIDGVVCGVNIRVAVLECRLEDEASRESAPGSRAVIRASISAGAFHVCDVGVLRANVNGVVLGKCRGDNIPGQSHERGRRSSLRWCCR